MLNAKSAAGIAATAKITALEKAWEHYENDIEKRIRFEASQCGTVIEYSLTEAAFFAHDLCCPVTFTDIITYFKNVLANYGYSVGVKNGTVATIIITW